MRRRAACSGKTSVRQAWLAWFCFCFWLVGKDHEANARDRKRMWSSHCWFLHFRLIGRVVGGSFLRVQWSKITPILNYFLHTRMKSVLLFRAFFNSLKNLTVITVDLFGFWLLIQFHTAEDQSGNFFTRETELFTKVVAEFVRKYWVLFVNFVVEFW